MGTPPCESGLLNETLAMVWDSSTTRTPYGLDGTSEKVQTQFKNQQELDRPEHKGLLRVLKGEKKY